MFDDLRDLLLRQPVAFNRGGVVRRKQPGRLPQSRQQRRRNGQILNGLPGRFDTHQRTGNLWSDSEFGLEWHNNGT
jgi:hypothetical protein